MTYERIRFTQQNGRRTSVILCDPIEVPFLNGRVVTGAEVDRQGCNVSRRHIIDTDAITDRCSMRMDLHYGELVTTPQTLAELHEAGEL